MVSRTMLALVAVSSLFAVSSAASVDVTVGNFALNLVSRTPPALEHSALTPLCAVSCLASLSAPCLLCCHQLNALCI